MPIEHNPFDDDRLIQIRESQEDPIVQYYIVRTDIPMTVGKVCAQIAHGAQMFAFAYNERCLQQIANDLNNVPFNTEVRTRIELTKKWINGSFRKVVLGGKVKDFEKIKKEFNVFLVKDAGLTEVEPGMETVLVTWPQFRSQCPKILKRLQTYK